MTTCMGEDVEWGVDVGGGGGGSGVQCARLVMEESG